MIYADWVQLNVRSLYGTDIKIADKYIIEECEKGTPIMKKRYIIKDLQSNPIATIMTHPIPDYIEENTIFIKFENYYLYQYNLDIVIEDFLKENNFTFYAFTRLDVCHDFNTFNKGLMPRKFIQMALQKQLVKVGDAKASFNGYIGESLDLNSICFGRPSSSVQAKMYNKSLEMKEVKFKNYIAQSWERRNLDKDHVWRIEFVLRGNDLRMTDVHTGESYTLKEYGLKILSNENLHRLWCNLQHKYFRWKVWDGGSNISYMADFELFNPILFRNEDFILTIDKRKASVSSRFDKMIIKQMCKILDEILDNEGYYWNKAANHFKNVIAFNIERKQLVDWAYKEPAIQDEVIMSLGTNGDYI